MGKFGTILGLVLLGGCTAGQVNLAENAALVAWQLAVANNPQLAAVASYGQLLCKTKDSVLAMVDVATGKPILAEGALAADLAKVCTVVLGIPTPPPVAGPVKVQAI